MRDRQAHGAEGAAAVTWERKDLSLPAYQQPSEPPITCGLLYRGKRHAISGPPESAKTLAALILGLEHVRAGNGRFAFVDFENDERSTRLLLDELGATVDEIADVYYVAPDGPPEPADLDEIEAAGVTFAIIDAAAGAYAVSDLDDNKRIDTEHFATTWITPLWRRGIATALIDHVVKNPDSRGRYAIGSERKLGMADVHLGLEAVHRFSRGGNGLIRITVHKDRPGHLKRPHAAELHLNSDPDTHQIGWEFTSAAASSDDGTADSWRPTVLMDRVVEHLSRVDEPVSRNDIVKAVTGKREYVLKAIGYLVDDGKIAEHGRKLQLVPGSQLVPNGSRNHSQEEPVPGSLSLQEEPLPGTTYEQLLAETA
jgi:hypothetical protein